MKSVLSLMLLLSPFSLSAETKTAKDVWAKIASASVHGCFKDYGDFVVELANRERMILRFSPSPQLSERKSIEELIRECKLALAQSHQQKSEHVYINYKTGELKPENGFFVESAVETE